MLRLAKPEDYKYMPEIGLWELSFDKRPVQGVRCEDPVIGAEQYNSSQIKLKKVRNNEKIRRANFFKLEEISWNGVFDWCIERGTPEECRLIAELYSCSGKEDFYRVQTQLKQHYGYFKESDLYLWTGLFFITGNRVASADKIQKVRHKGGE